MLRVAIFLLMFVASAAAQGYRYDNLAVKLSNGFLVPAGGATIRVCTEPATGSTCTPVASIYSDQALTTPLANPFTADANGNFGFYAASGIYHVQVSGSGISSYDLPYINLAKFYNINGIRFAGEPFNGVSTIQSAVDDAGTTGSVIVEPAYSSTETFTNTNRIGVFDVRHLEMSIRGTYPTREYSNISIGYSAGKALRGQEANAFGNILIGYLAGYQIAPSVSGSNGVNNTMIGDNICPNCTDITSNVGVGRSVFNALTTGSANNVAVGHAGAFEMTTGNNNVCVGDQACKNITTASNNVFLGLAAGYESTQFSGGVGLGYNAQIDPNCGGNCGVLGGDFTDASRTSKWCIDCDWPTMPLEIAANSAKATVATTNILRLHTSDDTDNFGLGISITGAAAIGSRIVNINTSETVSGNGGVIRFQSTGNGGLQSGVSFVFQNDNTNNIGSVVSGRPRAVYIGTTGLFINGGSALATSNQSGTGSLCMTTSCVMTTPTLGVASATSIAIGGGTALATSNQSGTGSICMTTSCAMTTPNIGAASATSVNASGAITGGTLAVGGSDTITLIRKATRTEDIASIAANTCTDGTGTILTGAVDGDPVNVGVTASVASTAGLQFTAYVSAADTVKVRVCNVTTGAVDPANATYKFTMIKIP